MTELSSAPVLRLAKAAGIERVDEEARNALADAADRMLTRKFKKVAIILNETGKKTLTKAMLDAI